MNDDDLTYIDEMIKLQGVAVATVSDGWVLVFTKKTLDALAQKASETGKVIVQVKSSAKSIKN